MIGQFPEVIDSSMIATFKSCPQLFKKIYIDQWKPKEKGNVHLIAGGAFAKGIEVARRSFFEGVHEKLSRENVLTEDGSLVTDPVTGKVKTRVKTEIIFQDNPGGDANLAEVLGLQAVLATYGDFECPADSPKSAERTAGALEFYLSSYPLTDRSGSPIQFGVRRAIEVNFAHPLESSHPQTGNPLLYVGRSDAIVQYAGDNYICDEKTTTSLGPTWSRQWDLRGQFLGYTWGFRNMGFRVAGVLVRGVSILKTKYDTQESINCFADWEVERWYRELLLWVEDMKICYQTGQWRYNLDHACAEYGGCGFKTACKSQNEQPWLEQFFERRHWDPVTRLETKL